MSEDTPPVDNIEEEKGLYPIDVKWLRIAFYGFWLLWISYILAETTTFERSQDWLFPYIIGIPVGIMILLKFFVILKPDWVNRFMPESEETEAEDDEFDQRIEEASEATKAGRSKKERQKLELLMIGWVIALPIMMFYLGIGNAIIVYVFGFTWYFVRRVRTALIVTLIVSGGIYILFLQILGMTFWEGVMGLPDPFVYVYELL